MTGKMFSVVTPIFPFFIVLSLLLYLISCPSCNKRCASTFFLPFCQPDLPKRSARLYNGANFYTFGGVTALFTGREVSNRPACPYLYITKTFANGFSETGEKAVRLPQIPLQASGAGETGADPRSGPRGPHGRQPPAPAAGGRAVEGGHGTPCTLHARFRRPDGRHRLRRHLRGGPASTTARTFRTSTRRSSPTT